MRSRAVWVGAGMLVVAAVVAAALVILQSADDGPAEPEPVLTAIATVADTGPTTERSPVALPRPVPTTTPAASPAAPVATPNLTGSPTADRPSVQEDPLLAVILPSPQGVVFREVGESVTLEVRGLYSNGVERVLPDQFGSAVVFSSSDSSVADVDNQGRITALKPGSVDILLESAGVRAEVSVIVHGQYVAVPPYDPQRVIELAPGVEIVVNRIIIYPSGDEYDTDMAHQIATDYDGQIVAEWPNLASFCIEVAIATTKELEALLLLMSADPRVIALQLDALYSSSDYHETPQSARKFARIPEASQLLRGVRGMSAVNIAVIDVNMAWDHISPTTVQAIGNEFDASRVDIVHRYPSRIILGSHGLAVTSVIAGQQGVLTIANAPLYRLHLYSVGENKPETAVVNSALDDMHSNAGHIDIVNMSIGSGCGTGTEESFQLESFVVGVACFVLGQDNLDKARFTAMPGTLFVAAAGNAGKTDGEWQWTDPEDGFPGGWANETDNIISVGALDHYAWHEQQDPREQVLGYNPLSTDRACYSLFGDDITLAAEGQSVYVLQTDWTRADGSGHTWAGGTSFAAPLVTGVAGLLKSLLPSLSPLEIKRLLVDSARDVVVDWRSRPDCGDAEQAVWKELDAAAAVDRLLDMAISAELRRRGVVVNLFSGRMDLQLELRNTGLRHWGFHLGVTATSPSGVRHMWRPGKGRGTNDVVHAGALQMIPVRASFETAESGEWTVRAIVSRAEIRDDGRGLICSDGFDSSECLGMIEFTINIRSSTTTLAPTPTPSAARPTPPAPVPDVPVPMEYWIDEEGLEGVEFVRPTATPSPSVTLPSPPTWSPAPTLAVSAGWAHTCAVEADGAVVCWGDDREGQASPPSGEFLSVSAGWTHTCGIRTDGSVECWGKDHQGQASPPDGEFVSVSAGWEDTCGVRTDGSLECWGRVTTFNLDKSPDALFRSVSVAQFHACGVMQDREVACWGGSHRTASLPPGPFASVSAGEGLGCGLRTDGSVACWGSDDSDQVSAPSGTFMSISASTEGHRACGVRTDGSALCWGAGSRVPAGARNSVLPVSIQPDGRFSSISAGAQHVCGTRPGGEVVCWGRNDSDRAVTPGVPLVSVSTGDTYECGLRVDGSVACYRHGLFEETNVPPGSFTSLSSGVKHNCAIKADGSLVCWGWNPYGQATAPAGTFVAIDLAWTHSCGLRGSGEIECWGQIDRTPPSGPFTALATGANGDGCGLRPDGSAECWGEYVTEENGPPDEAFTSVAVGHGHACGIKTDGTVACWGSLNTSGQASPPDGQFVAISLGDFHSCGLREGGEIECWVKINVGQAEAPEGTFSSISAHASRTCAVRTDGSYVCWGQ